MTYVNSYFIFMEMKLLQTALTFKYFHALQHNYFMIYLIHYICMRFEFVFYAQHADENKQQTSKQDCKRESDYMFWRGMNKKIDNRGKSVLVVYLAWKILLFLYRQHGQ